jgi:hypothetical protein
MDYCRYSNCLLGVKETIMSTRQWLAIACGVALIAGAPMAATQLSSGPAASDPDGLVEVQSNRFDQVYLRPGVDFRGYTKVMLGPAQVTFAPNWLTDMNQNRIAVLQGTTAADAERVADDVRASLREVFANTFRSEGYEIVTAPGPDVLDLSLGVVDLYINAPRTVTQALPSRVLTSEAGRATLALELRDATSGALLGRLVDRDTAGNRGGSRPKFRITTTVTNRFDFESLFGAWARYSIDELKAKPRVAMSVPGTN